MTDRHTSLRVKICGNAREQDALFAARCGADYLGYIFYEKSARHISLAPAAAIIESVRRLFPGVMHVGVFVNASKDVIQQHWTEARLDLIQLHGSESAEFCRTLQQQGMPVIKALRFGASELPTVYPETAAKYLLCDTYDPTLAGGTGHRFDRRLLPSDFPLERAFVAGGLTPETVAEVVSELRPYAVDVASGVEEKPGVKSDLKVRQFIERAKAD